MQYVLTHCFPIHLLFLAFYKTPEELQEKPNYYLSDADRLYWWDGTDEVRITEKTDEWLRKMAESHQEILKTVEVQQNAITAMQDFMKLLTDINEYYWRIFPFEEMFYDFLQNISRKEYAAAIELIVRLQRTKTSGRPVRSSNTGKTGNPRVKM